MVEPTRRERSFSFVAFDDDPLVGGHENTYTLCIFKPSKRQVPCHLKLLGQESNVVEGKPKTNPLGIWRERVMEKYNVIVRRHG